MSCLYILEINPLSVVSFCYYFLPFWGLIFTLLVVSFGVPVPIFKLFFDIELEGLTVYSEYKFLIRYDLQIVSLILWTTFYFIVSFEAQKV